MKKKDTNPSVLPLTGKSRWSQFEKFAPVSRETFRKLSLQGKAPQPERMGIRCTYYDNRELHKWLADPINYQVDQNEPILSPTEADKYFGATEKTLVEEKQRRELRGVE